MLAVELPLWGAGASSGSARVGLAPPLMSLALLRVLGGHSVDRPLVRGRESWSRARHTRLCICYNFECGVVAPLLVVVNEVELGVACVSVEPV